MGYAFLFLLIALTPYSVLMGITVKYGLTGRLRSTVKLLLFGGLGLVAGGGGLMGSVVLFSGTASQEFGFAIFVICVGGGGVWVFTGILAMVGGMAVKLAHLGEK